MQYQNWCKDKETNSDYLVTDTTATGITLELEGNEISLEKRTASVEFNRPFVVQATETMDLQSSYRGTEYYAYLSYSYQETEDDEDQTKVLGETEVVVQTGNPKFQTIKLFKPEDLYALGARWMTIGIPLMLAGI